MVRFPGDTIYLLIFIVKYGLSSERNISNAIVRPLNSWAIMRIHQHQKRAKRTLDDAGAELEQELEDSWDSGS